jgi:thiol-disulfide isomerase/thioredoxin
MSKLRCIACCLLLTAVFFGTSVIAQEFPFNGTWKIDFDAVTEQLSTASKDEKERELIAMKLERMKSLRYILNGDGGSIVNEGFPNTLIWKTRMIDESRFELANPNGDERCLVEMKSKDRLNFSTVFAAPAGAQENTFGLVRVSHEDRWQPPPEFKIGMTAPPIITEYWLNEPTRKVDLTDGRVYLIEFWATWCSPCLRKMPRLVELQKEIGEDRLAIVAISSESREGVTGFLDREGTNEQTAGSQVLEHSKSISIGVDRDSYTLRAYMVASGFRAIPTLFIVGKSGQVEWAGSSEDCEAVLRQVLEGSWDRQLFSERFAGIQRAYLELPRLVELVGKERHDDALNLIEELSKVADDQMKANLEAIRARVLKKRADN